MKKGCSFLLLYIFTHLDALIYPSQSELLRVYQHHGFFFEKKGLHVSRLFVFLSGEG
ncbi:MAG: hypothetical protein UV63_C0033G0017 [Microgenomates group bacterium GW2011_GWC1_43_11]|uniref:Uncharacterized protein n=1 Tax=Candidatus Gottesmanbacteria bacterium GW2011_GWB1_44_11c TaxID=1618447 RepID=A0A0G1J242_9BACT|nr:MAG: hypothetical protein UV63_C0033G0017 [Microgenomates group bacterium GW2011_GWC1_43_11]KKT38122.1 MAG: hypothetical protein UW22_C0013G0009 [Candidatus Gottesmanbacteria bacterium GW2011_GWB1_44_11c]